MAKSYQEAILDELEKIATREGLEVTISYRYTNTGTLRAGSLTETAARATFAFQVNHNVITFNDAQLGPGRDSWLWGENYPDHDDKVRGMLQRWFELVKESVA